MLDRVDLRGRTDRGHHPWTVRGAFTVALIMSFFVADAAPLIAATPAFDIEAHVQGSAAVIIVTFEQPAPPELEASGVLDRLVGIFERKDVDRDGRPLSDRSGQTVSLTKIDEHVFRGEVSIDPNLEWAVVPWPLVTNLQIGPKTATTVFLPSDDTINLIALTAGVVFLLAVVLGAFRLSRRLGRQGSVGIPRSYRIGG